MGKWMTSAATAVVATMLFGHGVAVANTLYFQINPNFDTSGSRQVFIFGAADTTGSVIGANGFNQAFDLGEDGFVTITIPVANELGNNTVELKGFRIESEGAVSGYLLNRRSASTDMTYLIDSTSLGTDHVVAGYRNIRNDQMSAQAVEDNTTITFTPTSGAPVQIVLNAGQTYMFSAGAELTGSRVTSDKPIAVFSGNQCANIPSNNTACDHLIEQIPSVDLLSTNYLLAKTPRTGPLGNVVRVVATEDNTEVRFNGTLVATLDAGQFHEGRVPEGLEIAATQKVLVAQYLIGTTQAQAVTDPAMVIIPGQEQWLDSYVFSTPSGEADFPTDFVSIIMESADISSLLINGVAADPNAFNPLGSTLFSYGDFDVSAISGPFSITADSPFLLLLSGFDQADSYFTYGGARFSPGASPPPPPPPPSGETDVFWDGDGNANNGVVDGGDGVLTATSANLTVDGGVTNNALPVDPANIIFTATPGVVTVDTSQGAIRILGLEFRVGGYSIVGDALTLAEPTTILVDGTMDSLATIDSVLQGTGGLTKTGAGRLVLNGANTYGGSTEVAAGTLEGSATSFSTGAIAIAATLVVNQPSDATLANVLGGAGNLVKAGAGRLTLTAESDFSGLTTVEAGRLQVNGALSASVVTVNAGASLGGTGSVGGVDALTGSTVAPGASIGTLSVTGDYAQAAGSIYQVETLSTGANDRILVSGAATIEPGAVLQLVKLDAPRFVLGTRYTVLTAAGGRTGSYLLTGPTQVSQFINVVANYDASNVYLDVLQTRALAAAGQTPNQIAAASGADAAGNGAMYDALVYLQSDAEARAAFDQISGEIHASARGATLQDSRFVREAVGSRLSSDLGGRSIWIHGYGATGRFSADGNAARVSRDLAGFFIGGDLPVGEDMAVGIVAGYGGGNIKVSDRNSRADTSDFHLGGYFAYTGGPARAHFGLANMWRDVKTRRSIGFAGFNDQTQANYDLSLFQMFGDIGYAFDLGAAELEPFFSLAYVDVGSSRFHETGGDAKLSSVGSNSSDYWVTQLGTRLRFGLGSAEGGLGAVASLGWRRYSGDSRTTPLAMGFAAGPAFSIAGAPIARDAAAIGLSVAGKVSERVEIDVGYSGQAGSGLSDHGGRASLTFRF